MKITEAAERVLKEDPRTRDSKYNWLYILKVLQLMGFKIYIPLAFKLPSPDSMLVLRRTLLHKKNLFPGDFMPEENVIYQRPIK